MSIYLQFYSEGEKTMRVNKELSWVMLGLMMIISIQMWKSCDGCLDTERTALLEIKSAFNSPFLSSWGLNANCCSWKNGIECNSSTGRVIKLNLDYSRDLNSGDRYLNASLFLPFQELKTLSLWRNQIVDCIKNEGFEKLSKLENLEVLDLSYNSFSNNIISSLSALSSLKSLYLKGNRLDGTLNTRGGDEALNLSKLEYLDLSRNNLDNSILPFLSGLSSLKFLHIEYNQLKGALNLKELDALSNLEELHLSGNQIDKFEGSRDIKGLSTLSTLALDDMMTEGGSSLLESLEALPYLKTLYLRSNNFKGVTIGKGLCQLKYLEELDLRYNDLSGSLPLCLANLISLQRLDLSSNQLIGNISSSPLTSLTSLQYLDLSNNLFYIPISLFTFFNHSKLKFLDGGGNNIYADIEEYHTSIPQFQLDFLYLYGYGNVGRIPKFLYYQRNLQSVYLSSLKMEGQFPYWLLENNTKLEHLYLANNSLLGSLELPIHPHMNLKFLDISENCFYGYIPMEIGICFPSLVSISMSQNGFNGSIPSSFGEMSYLKILDISKNKISGSLSSKFIPSGLGELHLSKNNLQGSLENGLYSESCLTVLDLSHNNFSGSIPIWISMLSELSYLLLGHNNFEGHIPHELCKLETLSLIDLSNNNLSGHIIPCLRASSLHNQNAPPQQSLEFAAKNSSYDFEAIILFYLSGIDLSSNNLSGEIPLQFGSLFTIKVLNLSHNGLTGPIPSTFSNLSAIESLDLSYNNLNGQIPPQLTLLHSLAVFIVAYNNLSGKTPERVAQFATFEQGSYEGNRLLCGPPLPKSCDPTSAPLVPKTSMDENEYDGFMDMDVFYISFGVAYVMVLLGIAAVLYINPYWRRVWFYLIEVSLENCYYFIIDNLCFRFKFYRFCK